MSSQRERDYFTKHQLIRNKLADLSDKSGRACFDVARLAAELKMDIRTIRAHLRIMEIDAVGAFMDSGEKQFCTKQGIATLASKMKLNGNSEMKGGDFQKSEYY